MKRRLSQTQRENSRTAHATVDRNAGSGQPKNGVGCVVFAIAGRDKGNYFLIIGEDPGGMAYIANGRSRPVQSPKLKNWKHLRLCGNAGPEWMEKLKAGTLSNRDISRFLSVFVYGPQGEIPQETPPIASETHDC